MDLNLHCAACGKSFVRKNKGFSRTSCKALGSESTVAQVLGKLRVDFEHAYLCNDCRNMFKRKTVPMRGKGIKRKMPPSFSHETRSNPKVVLVSSTSIEPPQKQCVANITNCEQPFQRATKYLKQYKYVAAFRDLTKHSDAARMALIQVSSEIMLEEVNMLFSSIKLMTYISFFLQ